jgi:MFS family permease
VVRWHGAFDSTARRTLGFAIDLITRLGRKVIGDQRDRRVVEIIPRRPWRALASRDYRIYFTGHILSQTGAWVHRLAQSWLVLELTGSALALGLLSVIEFGPMLLLSPFAGALGDRWPRRRLLAWVQGALTVQGLILAWLVFTGTAQVWQIYAAAFTWGVVHSLDGPVKHAFIADLVKRDALASAVGLNSAALNGARIIGPTIGGVLISTVGIGWCFVFSGLSHVAILAAIVAVRARPAAAAPTTLSLFQDVRDGIGYARGNPAIAVPLLMLAIAGTFGFNWSVALPLLARFGFDSGAMAFGLMNAALGFGALAGGVLVASRSAPADRTLAISASLFALGLFTISRLSQLEAALITLWCIGFLGVFYTASTQAALQLRTEERFRGRVMSLYTVIFGGFTPVGSGFTSVAANALGVREALAINAGICVFGAGLGLWVSVRSRRGPTTSAVRESP